MKLKIIKEDKRERHVTSDKYAAILRHGHVPYFEHLYTKCIVSQQGTENTGILRQTPHPPSQ